MEVSLGQRLNVVRVQRCYGSGSEFPELLWFHGGEVFRLQSGHMAGR